MNLWDAVGLNKPCVLACTGAGGKTSLLRTLAGYAQTNTLPVLITTTTKMYYSQAADFNPIFSYTFAAGASVLANAASQVTAWFSRRQGDKVTGLPPEWIDSLAQSGFAGYILVEADGAAGRWLKAPAGHEPVVPASTAVTVGVLNLQAIGHPLAETVVHRLHLVLSLLNKEEGQLIEWRDLALLAAGEKGIFQYSRGEKVLLLTGAEAAGTEYGLKIAAQLRLAGTDIRRCILAANNGLELQPVEVQEL